MFSLKLMMAAFSLHGKNSFIISNGKKVSFSLINNGKVALGVLKSSEGLFLSS
jgi:hypothetical protein